MRAAGFEPAIPASVTGDFFRAIRQFHVPWGRLSL